MSNKPVSSNAQNRAELLRANGGGGGGLTNPAYQGTSPVDSQPMDMQQINLRINERTDQSLQSTRRMVGLLEESHAAGAKTMESLHKQGEQLAKIEGQLDDMQEDLREAEQNMEQMEKCCGLFVCPWRKRPTPEATKFDKISHRTNADAVRMEQPGSHSPHTSDRNHLVPGGPRQKAQFQRITNDAREDEMEENLDQVSGMLDGLKTMATDMGTTIRQQTTQIDRMHDKTVVTDDRVVRANQRANDILKKA